MKSSSIKYRLFKSHLLRYCVCILAALTAVPLLAIIGKVAVEGVRHLDWQFFTQAMPGGIANGIVGSLLMLLVASALAVPVGIGAGLFLSDHRHSKVAQALSYLTDMLQGTPSVIIGIVVYIWVVVPSRGYSGLAGSVALFIMMLPLIVRSTEETLNMLPSSLKEAATALGGNYWRTVVHVLLPSAYGGISTGILLAVSRVMGETAPLMFTALGCAVIETNLARPMSAVPLLIWQFFNDPNLQSLIWSASLLLLLFVLGLNLLAKYLKHKMTVH